MVVYQQPLRIHDENAAAQNVAIQIPNCGFLLLTGYAVGFPISDDAGTGGGVGQPFHEVLELLKSLAHRVMLLVVGAGYQILEELTRRRGHHRPLGEYQHRLKCTQHPPSYDSSAAGDSFRPDRTQPEVFEMFRHLGLHELGA